MPKTLTLSEPELSIIAGARTVKWSLLDEKGRGYRISWTEEDFSTFKPKCSAFQAERYKGGFLKIGRYKQAVSYKPDAALALNDVMKQLSDKYGYVYGIDPGQYQLLPGEVVADD
nr:MAG TPA: hypothetical protein [Caudoviricetes sp.]